MIAILHKSLLSRIFVWLLARNPALLKSASRSARNFAAIEFFIAQPCTASDTVWAWGQHQHRQADQRQLALAHARLVHAIDVMAAMAHGIAYLYT